MKHIKGINQEAFHTFRTVFLPRLFVFQSCNMLPADIWQASRKCWTNLRGTLRVVFHWRGEKKPRNIGSVGTRTCTSLQMCQPPLRYGGREILTFLYLSPIIFSACWKKKTKTTTKWWPNNQKYAFSASYPVIPARKPDPGSLRMPEVGLDENSHKLF